MRGKEREILLKQPTRPRYQRRLVQLECIIGAGLIVLLCNLKNPWIQQISSWNVTTYDALLGASENSHPGDHSFGYNNNSSSSSNNNNNITNSQNMDSFWERMNGTLALRLSSLQQASFESKRLHLPNIFPLARRHSLDTGQWGANQVTKEWAYLHIYKNGGTTVLFQTGRDHVPVSRVRTKKWFTVVRDPIHHFLSGWSECGDRSRRGRRIKQGLPPTGPLEANETIPPNLLYDYDFRVARWLVEVQSQVMTSWSCHMHCFPQVNYMLNSRNEISPELQIVGDLGELPAMLDFIGFKFREDIPSGRNATADPFLTKFYPRRTDLLSNETVLKLCDFLAIDYYLLEYPLPEACEGMPVGGYSQWPRRPKDVRTKRLTRIKYVNDTLHSYKLLNRKRETRAHLLAQKEASN